MPSWTSFTNIYAGRPPATYPEKMTKGSGRRQDLSQSGRILNHTGAHKINNASGGLCWRKNGQDQAHSRDRRGPAQVATATVAAYMGMDCEVLHGLLDMERQALNVYSMRLMGHRSRRGRGHRNAEGRGQSASGEWTSRISDTHYLLGSCMGPHPFPHRPGLSGGHLKGDQAADAGPEEGKFLTQLSPASAAAPTPSAPSTTLSRIPAFG